MTKTKNRVGEKYITNEGYELEILQYSNAKGCIVKINGSVILSNCRYDHIKSGKIRNPYHRSTHGKGFLGIGEHRSQINGKPTAVYATWRHMFDRCYDEKDRKRTPTYTACEVDETWDCLQNFGKWYEENNFDGWQLDKDILVKGNKVYSPATCAFVPKEINMLFVKHGKKRGSCPIGVTSRGKKFSSQISINGNYIHLGIFDTPELAFQAYKVEKETEIKRVADKWKPDIKPEVYEALYNYKVEITD